MILPWWLFNLLLLPRLTLAGDVPHEIHEVAKPVDNYDFGYEIKEPQAHKFHRETGDSWGRKQGAYGFTDPDGRQRVVEYVADEHGFRAKVKTNEPGTSTHESGGAITIKKDDHGLVAQETPFGLPVSHDVHRFQSPILPLGPVSMYSSGHNALQHAAAVQQIVKTNPHAPLDFLVGGGPQEFRVPLLPNGAVHMYKASQPTLVKPMHNPHDYLAGNIHVLHSPILPIGPVHMFKAPIKYDDEPVLPPKALAFHGPKPVFPPPTRILLRENAPIPVAVEAPFGKRTPFAKRVVIRRKFNPEIGSYSSPLLPIGSVHMESAYLAPRLKARHLAIPNEIRHAPPISQIVVESPRRLENAFPINTVAENAVLAPSSKLLPSNLHQNEIQVLVNSPEPPTKKIIISEPLQGGFKPSPPYTHNEPFNEHLHHLRQIQYAAPQAQLIQSEPIKPSYSHKGIVHPPHYAGHVAPQQFLYAAHKNVIKQPSIPNHPEPIPVPHVPHHSVVRQHPPLHVPLKVAQSAPQFVHPPKAQYFAEPQVTPQYYSPPDPNSIDKGHYVSSPHSPGHPSISSVSSSPQYVPHPRPIAIDTEFDSYQLHGKYHHNKVVS